MHRTAIERATTSDPTQSAVTSHDEDDTEYTNVQISHTKTQEVPLYSTAEMPQTSTQEDEVAYASVQFLKESAATRWACMLITADFIVSIQVYVCFNHNMGRFLYSILNMSLSC